MKSSLISKFLAIGCIVVLSSCGHTIQQKQLSVFPMTPAWTPVSKYPAKEVLSNGDIVVEEALVKRHIQQKKYIERVLEWKQLNEIP